MLHVSGNGVAVEKEQEDGLAPIQRTLEEHSMYDQESLERAMAREADLANGRCDKEFPSIQQLGVLAKSNKARVKRRFSPDPSKTSLSQ